MELSIPCKNVLHPYFNQYILDIPLLVLGNRSEQQDNAALKELAF